MVIGEKPERDLSLAFLREQTGGPSNEK